MDDPTLRCWLLRLLTSATFLIVGSTSCATSEATVVNVYVASSISHSLEQVTTAFEQDNPEVDVRLNVAGSQTLLRQIEAGGDADVFIAADIAVLEALAVAPVEKPQLFLANSLVLAVPVVHRSAIKTISDLEKRDVVVARCALGAPCGNATQQFLDSAEITLDRASEHPNVGLVVEQVASGEVDAGFVYQTDIDRNPDRLRPILLPDAPTVQATVAILDAKAATKQFVEHLHSDESRSIFREAGFIAL